MEVWDKTYWITFLISAVVSEEAKDGPVGTDGSEGHTAAAWEREALFCFCINFCNLRQTKMYWPLVWQNSQWVYLEDWKVGHPEFSHGGAMNTWSNDDMWWVGQWFSLKMSSLTVASREGVGDR